MWPDPGHEIKERESGIKEGKCNCRLEQAPRGKDQALNCLARGRLCSWQTQVGAAWRRRLRPRQVATPHSLQCSHTASSAPTQPPVLPGAEGWLTPCPYPLAPARGHCSPSFPCLWGRGPTRAGLRTQREPLTWRLPPPRGRGFFISGDSFPPANQGHKPRTHSSTWGVHVTATQ